MERGLTQEKAQANRQLFGANEIRTKESITWLTILVAQFLTLLNGILILAVLFSVFIGDILDGIFIVLIILLNAIFGFIQEYRAERSLEKLKKYTAPESRVIRDGKEIVIPSAEIVPDDLVVLTEGERIPADGVVVHCRHLEVDESLLTGESLPVIKEIGESIYTGTLVIKGRGNMRVSTIGTKTRFGQIAQSLSAIEPDKTPLQKNLNELGKILTLIAASIALLLIPIGIIQGKEFIPLTILAISIAVAAIPEGLPAVITIALAVGTNRMAKQNAIVRKMPAIETLGAMQIVLVDKTGTLTLNQMRVKDYWTNNKDHMHYLLHAAVLGNTASLIKKADSNNYDIIGDRTDGSLLLWAQSLQEDINATINEGQVLDEYVFDVKTKTITTVWKHQDKKYVFVRGAPESLIQRSSITSAEKITITEKYEQYAKQGLRIIAFGYKIEHHNDTTAREHLEKNLTFLGIVGINDPPRREVKQALRQARQAGIQVIMVTGDNELTALAIAKEIGLIEKDEDVITGEELEKISDAELLTILKNTRVFARAKPHDKLRLVSCLKKEGFVVGVTGDGVNDALALKKSDVGVAMGESGTDVAKDASDIIITDDNFSTLIKAVGEGRTIYHNILKSITYLLSGNLSELSLVFFATVMGIPTPLLPTQILWINIVTDGLPALALATDTAHPDVLKNLPRDSRIPILTKQRLSFIGIIGFGFTLLLLSLFHTLLQYFNEDVARTIIFNALILSHLVIAFIVRGQSLFRINKFLLVTVFLTLAIQMVITTVPFFQSIFHLALP